MIVKVGLLNLSVRSYVLFRWILIADIYLCCRISIQFTDVSLHLNFLNQLKI